MDAPTNSDERTQQEQLLQVILDSTPAALLLVGETGNIVFTNAAARQLFFEGREPRGENFLQMLSQVAEPLRRALLSDVDQIFTFEEQGEKEIYHLAKSHFALSGETHALISVRHMTLEISREEISMLKRTLRIIGHELGNSMTPVTSLLHSAQRMLASPELHPKLATSLQIIEDRLSHLHGFLTNLARLGQLPKPQRRDVSWPEFLDGLRTLWPDVEISPPPQVPGWFDPIQIQQVLINLVKNAREAGGPPDGVAINVETTADGSVRFAVLDRGPGMSDEVMSKTLIPAFTTKKNGSGMGLTLCREIVDAHDGRLRIGRREGAGTVVSFWLPSRTSEPALSRARLTLTGTR
jgi:two-component system nitrogen regulation sensor histidine kinase NtrY